GGLQVGNVHFCGVDALLRAGLFAGVRQVGEYTFFLCDRQPPRTAARLLCSLRIRAIQTGGIYIYIYGVYYYVSSFVFFCSAKRVF
ncbi:unnamed protein product, partial [Pylaiella littoralis]